MLFLALFARDGRFQMITSAASLALLAVVVTRWNTISRLTPGPLLLFVTWAAASAAWSAVMADSIAQIVNLAVWTSLGLALASTGSAREVCRVWARASYPALGLAVLTSLQFASGSSSEGFYNSKNHLGYAAAASLIPLIALHWPHRKTLVFAAVGAAFFAGAMANSQTGVTLSITIPLLFVVASILAKLRGTALSAAGLIAFGGVGVVGVVALQIVIEWLTELLGRDTKLSGRDEIWDAVEGAIRERPVFGTGIGGVWKRPADEPTLGILLELPVYLRDATVYAHNGFLDAGLQLGLVGLALLVLVILVSLRRSVKFLSTQSLTAAAMPFVVTLTYIVANVTETRLYNDQAWVILVAALAVPAGRRMLDGSDEASLPEVPLRAERLRGSARR